MQEDPTRRPGGDELNSARESIDAADRALLELLGQRFDAIRRIASLKGQDGKTPLLDPERERLVLDRWTAEARSLGVPVPLAREVLREILRYSRRVQEPLLGDSPPVEGRRSRVAVQGVGNCYSALAAQRLFATRSPAGVEVVEHQTFFEAVGALEEGTADYALLPVENSIGGSIVDVTHIVCDRALFAVDEEIWQVRHVVAGLPGAALKSLRHVRSHPAALAQCERFFRRHPEITRAVWFDTAGAAESVAAEGRNDTAAICSAEAAAANGLAVLSEEVADREPNETRFLLLGLEPEVPPPTVPCKTSVIFRVHHHEGALARVLQVFADARANLLRIESRPYPGAPWEYQFLIDVEGHQQDEALAAALLAARKSCNHLRVAGTYPLRTHRRSPVDEPERPSPTPAPPPAPSGIAVESAEASAPTPAEVRVGPVTFGGGGFTLIAGPCAVESRSQVFEAAALAQAAGAVMLRGGAYKPRTSPYSFQGLGREGLIHLRDAGREYGMPVVTELLGVEQLDEVLEHADKIQVGARNMQNFPLLKELGRIDRPILLKRGMSATVKELVLAAEYILSAGNQQVVLCERGIRTFEPSTRSTLDLAAVPVLRRQTPLPIIVDPSHAAGRRDLVEPLALAAVAAGADGLIVEIHPRPDEALCDREQALTGPQLATLNRKILAVLAARQAGGEPLGGDGADQAAS